MKFTYRKLLVLVGDASAQVDCVHIVGEQSVARVLRDDTERDDNRQSPAVALGANKVKVSGSLGCLSFDAHGFLNLLVLILNCGVLSISPSMELSEHVEGFL